MAKRPLSAQLDLAVEALLGRAPSSSPTDARLAPLVRIARQLLDLPAVEYRERLKADLMRRFSMTATKVRPIRKGFHTVTPYLTVREPERLIDFVKQAFGAEELVRGTGSAGGLRAEMRIGDSMVMIGGGGAWRGQPMPTALHLYVPDAEAVYRRALAAGAASLEEPQDTHGDRLTAVKDRSGNEWYICTHLGRRYVPEGMYDVTAYLHPSGAGELLEFLKRAFAAEELACYRSHEGIVHHAKFRIGDSVVEMGEAHGKYGPMPTLFYLYVDDVDTWYERAVAAGATSLSPPAGQGYGDRVGAVSDPAGNHWHIGTHVKD